MSGLQKQNYGFPRERRRTLSTKLRETVEDFKGYGFDWDGHDGLPMRGDVYQFLVYRFCGPLGVNLSDRELPSLTVELLGDGTIEIEFLGETRKLLLSIYCEGVIGYGKGDFDLDGEPLSSVVGVIRTEDRVGMHSFAEVNDLLDWLSGKED